MKSIWKEGWRNTLEIKKDCVYDRPKADDQAMIDHTIECVDYVKRKYFNAGKSVTMIK